jgi:hypothetical protein
MQSSLFPAVLSMLLRLRFGTNNFIMAEQLVSDY